MGAAAGTIFRKRAAALLLLDSNPPLTATLFACAALGDSAPYAQRDQAQRDACTLAQLDLRDMLCMHPIPAARLIVALAAGIPKNARQSLFASVIRDPGAIWSVAECAWVALDDDERIVIAGAAAQHNDAECMETLLARLDADRIVALDAASSAALIDSAARSPYADARAIEGVGAKALALLSDEDRVALLDNPPANRSPQTTPRLREAQRCANPNAADFALRCCDLTHPHRLHAPSRRARRGANEC